MKHWKEVYSPDISSSMKDIIELLQQEKNKTIEALRKGEQEKLQYLQQINKALGWLIAINNNELDISNRYEVHQLPARGGIWFYPLMIDNEVDDRELWSPYILHDKPLELSGGDVLLLQKY